MGKIMGMMGNPSGHHHLRESRNSLLGPALIGAGDGIRTRDPCLGTKGYDIGGFVSFGSAEQGLSRRLFRLFRRVVPLPGTMAN